MLKMKIREIFFVLICYSSVLVYSESKILLFNGDSSCESEKAASIDLSSNGLVYIKASFAKSSGIKYLNLRNNTIYEIDNRAFDDLPELVCVDLSQNNIRFEQYGILYSKTIQTLILNDAIMNENGGSIRAEMIIRFGLTAVPNLKKLYLDRNNMISTYGYSNQMMDMYNVPNLTHLYLNENKITSTDFLQFLPSTLTHLYLNRNEISHLSCTTFNNLHVLVMDYNQINSLCGQDFNCNGISLRGAVNLRNISITNVGLQEIESDAFEDQTNLDSLDMSHNMLYEFVRHTFDNLTNLTTFRLDSNQLSVVPDICQLKKLEFFSLAYNQIAQIYEQPFCYLPKLKTLILKNNQINHIVHGIFNGLTSLEELDLSSNGLTSMSENWITSNSIRRLNLANNLFTNFANILLENIKTLVYLDIAKNPLQLITVKNVMSLPNDTTIHLNDC